MVIRMEQEYFNQRINCNVTHCAYYDQNHNKCTLGSITVGVNGGSETLCENYEKNSD